MANDSGPRPLLPHTAQYNYPTALETPRETQRNYVFVDEHNRHKRLKVMRACEGCRRRKIKCDAATTNTWPCAACTRLKLHCVPPTVSYEKDMTPGVHTFEVSPGYGYVGMSGAEDYQRQPPMLMTGHGVDPHGQSAVSYPPGIPMYHQNQYMETPSPQDGLPYANTMPPTTAPPPQDIKYQQHHAYATPTSATGPSSKFGDGWRSDMSTSGLTEALGELKINHDAVAPYIVNQKEILRGAPAIEEIEVNLPQQTSPDHTVRIPPSMMPSEQQALHYFEYFFTHIHPYVPVISPAYFYRQWHHSRDLISPLVLEGIFACSSLMLDGLQEGSKWLALASKHEESFKDVSRLSTIQASLLILKARESAPKRGYFYRSWMSVVNLVAMAKDLELNEHSEMHKLGQPCSLPLDDCVTKSRIWQTLFVLEIMIGGPQGRSDFGVNLDTIDMNPPQPTPGLEENEFQVSRQFSCLMGVIKNVQHITILYGKMKRTKRPDWAMEHIWTSYSPAFPAWLNELPQDMQIAFPADGSPPWLSSGFLGNMHCYHYLSQVMYHRPQIDYLTGIGDKGWKTHMLISHNAAKNMCRIQESIYQTDGLPGLLCMQRGISFTIYCVLTCTMLHLAAITCPDPEINTDARDFFTRHMRILEYCTPVWPMPEVQEQIHTLREAFSADTSKPFELKPSFPFGTPNMQNNPSPVSHDGSFQNQGASGIDMPFEAPPGQVYSTHPMTPPISTTDSEPRADSPVAQSLAMMSGGQRHVHPPPQHPHSSVQQQQQRDPIAQWNPNKIFDQWNTAFGTPTSNPSQPPPPPQMLRQQPPSTGMNPSTTAPSPTSYPRQESYSPHASNVPVASLPSNQPQPPQVAYAPPAAPYVTPSMWQDVVASTLGDGLKRRWQPGFDDPSMMGQIKRSR
ncbi:hypothetical protein K402DRAFT_322048 [Aulographum hederae CBS 113979]|uniref:Zn(2)-C6 fungal-type domain-containing protein n=1 Tax=Aulographum hederae CBS 113979 TaxID=1176131 RepID=A0A6G1HFX8_9PEZI|nr:hypothetical protein K402DRAFT_322048 [Aulographum hederae CBS 113979]